MDSVKPSEHVFNEELGFAINVGRLEARIFFDWHGFRFTVHCRSRGKDKAAGSVGNDGLEKGEGRGGVIAEIDLRLDHGFAGFDQGCKVQNSIKRGALLFRCDEKFLDRGTIGQIALDENYPLGNHFKARMAQIVEYNRLVTLSGKQSRHSATDISRTAGNQYPHKNTVLPEHFGLP